MSVKSKIQEALSQYNLERKEIEEQRQSLSQREKVAFSLFINQCSQAHSSTFFGTLLNPFEEKGVEFKEEPFVEEE